MYYKTTTLKRHINDRELSDKFWDVMKSKTPFTINGT